MKRAVYRVAGATALLLILAIACSQAVQADEPFPAHRVVGNVYYVGSKDLATYLITTPEGHILINSGFEETVPLIRVAVESLGFKMTDVKILLASHAHSDHVAGHALLQELTGAKVYVMRGDDEVIASGGKGSTCTRTAAGSRARSIAFWRTATRSNSAASRSSPVARPATPAAARPGPGASTDGGKTYDVVVIGSPNVNPGYQLVEQQGLSRNRRRLRQDVRGSQIAALRRLPRRPRRLLRHGREARAACQSGVNPFIDPDGYKAYIDLKEKAFRRTLAEQSSQ